jgi:Flp pilus assembly protein TadG
VYDLRVLSFIGRAADASPADPRGEDGTVARRSSSRNHARQRSRSRGRHGQAMVETALSLPLFLLMLCGTVDLGRAIYVRLVMGSDAIESARQISLADNRTSDCSSMTASIQNGNGIVNAADPQSVDGNTDPTLSGSRASTPPAGQGYLYLFPAVAPAPGPPTQSVCSGYKSRAHGKVVAQITYQFVPWTPGIAQIIPNGITMRTTVSELTQY